MFIWLLRTPPSQVEAFEVPLAFQRRGYLGGGGPLLAKVPGFGIAILGKPLPRSKRRRNSKAKLSIRDCVHSPGDKFIGQSIHR
jgi:hypothetical protein